MRREEGVGPMIKEAQERFKKDKEWVRSGILQEIFEERNSQVSKNLREDYNLTEWLALIGLYCSQAFINYDRNARNSSKRSLIKAAALILAAVENFYYDTYKLPSSTNPLSFVLHDYNPESSDSLKEEFYLGNNFFHIDGKGSVFVSRDDHRVMKTVVDNFSNSVDLRPTSTLEAFLLGLSKYISEKIGNFDVILESYDKDLKTTIVKVIEYRQGGKIIQHNEDSGNTEKGVYSISEVNFNPNGYRSSLPPNIYLPNEESEEEIRNISQKSFRKFLITYIITNYKFVAQDLAYRIRVVHLKK